MPITVDEIKTELSARGFPCIVDDYTAIVNKALRTFNRYFPITAYALFKAVEDVQDYYVFNPDDAQTHVETEPESGEFVALLAGATSVSNVYWNPGGDISDFNVFSPGWQFVQSILLFQGDYFNYPSSAILFKQKMESFRDAFGAQGFELVGPVGNPNSFLRIYPVPRSAETGVVVEFTKGWSLDDIDQDNDKVMDYFYMWLEAETARAVANKLAMTAGIEIMGFTDSQAGLRYWDSRAKDLKTQAEQAMNGIDGLVLRS